MALATLFGAGTLSAALPAGAVTFNVGNETQLRDAVTNAQNGDTIVFTANISLSTALPPLQRNVTINGASNTLTGSSGNRGLLVQSGTVVINDLNIAFSRAQGGNGGDGGFLGGGGGGGAGLGGAVFVATGANVTMSNVRLLDNQARGGDGGGRLQTDARGGGGGGGMTGNGAPANAGGQGGAGGGGDGGVSGAQPQPGGFGGGGGGGGAISGGAGGFGGGGGGDWEVAITAGAGGFGGGNGGAIGGGGGAGLGGAIFVQEGGTLTLAGTLEISGNAATGGSAQGSAQPGRGLGSGMFLQSNGSLTLNPGVGQTQTISDAIADQTGIAGSGGSWSLVKNGAGTTILTGANAYSGGITVNAGVLQGNASGLRGNIINNASVVFDQAGSGTHADNISGTGTLTKTGTGDLTLTGTNTYSGGTTVNGGMLLFISDANLGAAGNGIALNNGGIGTTRDGGLRRTLTINRPVTITTLGEFRTGWHSLSWTGVIGGAGPLVKSGEFQLELAAANTYSGGTMVTGGLLTFTNDANLGAAGTAIILNGGTIGTTDAVPATTSFSRDITLGGGGGGIDIALHPVTWNGDIGGSGVLSKQGNGELELTGTNTYGGGTQVARGTLRIASDDKLGAAGTPLHLVNNGALRASETFTTARAVELMGAGGVFIVDAGKELTLSGGVGGPGSLTKVGDGTLVLTGASSYAGHIFNNGGTVQGNTRSLRGNIAFDPNPANPSARTVIFDQAFDATYAGTITGRGRFTKAGAGTLTLSGDNSYSAGTVVLAGVLKGTTRSVRGAIRNNATLIFDQDFDGTQADVIVGTGALVKNGGGKLTLAADSTQRGGTTLNTGGLAINAALTSNVTMNGGFLSGVGNIHGNLTQNGGEIEPGNSIGNLTIDGNFTMQRGILEIEISPNGTSDRLTVIGAGNKATLNGGTVEIIALPGAYTPNTTYTIVATSGGVVGTFDNVTEDFAFLTPTLSYDANNVYLSLLLGPNAFRSAGQTVNQQAVGGALDAVAAGGYVGGLVTAIANLSTAQGAPALQALSGQPYADFGTVNIRASQLFMNAVGRQMAVERGAGRGGAGSVALAEACDIACDAGSETGAPRRFSAWLSAIGGTGSVLGDNNAAGLTYTMGGTAFGIDYRPDPRFLLGLAGSYVGGTQWVNSFLGNGHTDAVSVALYGSFTQGGFYADALAGYANASNRMQRIVSVPGLATGIANGSTNANQFLGQIETGYKIGLDAPAKTSISPFAHLQVGTVNQAGFTENGGSFFNLTIASQNTTSVRSTFGADFAADFDLGGGTKLGLGLRLGWMHEYADTARPMTAAFASAPGAQFTVFGATPQRDSAVLGLSAVAAVSEMTSLYLNYDGEVGGGTDNHALRAGMRLSW